MRSNTTILSSFSAAFTNSYEALPPKGPVTIHQKSLLLWWMTLTVLWVYRKFVSQILRRKQHEGMFFVVANVQFCYHGNRP